MASVWPGSSVLARDRVRLTRSALLGHFSTLFNEGKGLNERPTAPKHGQLKADSLGPNLQRFPNGKGFRWATYSKLTVGRALDERLALVV